MSKEAMQLALEALELYQSRMSVQMFDEAVKALRQALETEPFEYWNAVEGWVKIDEMREHFDAVGCGTIYKSAGEGRSPLYTAPQSNTSEIWARVDKDGNVTHLDMELCAKGPHNAYTALAMAIWNKAIETEREKVAAWMMRQGYATGHGDTVEDLLQELDWQIKEKQEPMTFVCSTGSCRFTLTQTGVGIGERGMQAYEEAKKRGWVGISDERLMDTDLLRKCLDALEYEAQRGNDDAYRELRDALKERLT